MTSDTTVQFDFSEALTLAKQGKRVRRLPWPTEYLWIECGANRFWLGVRGPRQDVSRCIAGITEIDMLADDWVEVEEPLPLPLRRDSEKLDKLIETIRRA